MTDYQRAYRKSLDDPSAFWGEAAEGLSWDKRWDRVFDDTRPPFYQWFSGGVINTCFNALDRHVKGGRGQQLALIYDSPVTGTVSRFTFQQLLTEVALFGGALRKMGVGKG